MVAEDAVGCMLGARRAGVVGVHIVPARAGATLLGGETALAVEIDFVADLAEYFIANGA